ncbi:MAG TPA: SGNH/GDSL hydrolase family protein [Solirubrobacterales bacterium]|nr:SGNH/GDSL hydrolase family protein [Solirubrobacterales bacterium]
MTLDPLAEIARVLAAKHDSSPGNGTELALYVAIGDSFTAGTGCEPGEAWAERLAAGLRRRHRSLAFRNLAVEGATSAEVRDQLPEAIELEPDLVTVVCGANDVLLTTRPDIPAYARRLAAIIGRLRGANPGVRIVTATAPDRWDFLELRPRTRRRVEQGIGRLNRATRTVASSYGVPCLDVASHPALSVPENFAPDGLHPSAVGHARAARGFAALLAAEFGIDVQT